MNTIDDCYASEAVEYFKNKDGIVTGDLEAVYMGVMTEFHDCIINSGCCPCFDKTTKGFLFTDGSYLVVTPYGMGSYPAHMVTQICAHEFTIIQARHTAELLEAIKEGADESRH